jgi:hypothetical protein
MKKRLLFFTLLTWSLTGYLQSTTTFNYTGGMQTFIVPAGVTQIDVDVMGAEGGDAVGNAVGWSNGPVNMDAGNGGRVTASYNVTPGETLYIFVGGEGSLSAGGYNGGGNPAVCSGTEVIAAGGGGGSDIRQGGTGIANRIIVAGGGGGASGSASPGYTMVPGTGAGGGLTGGNSQVTTGGCLVGIGGTQLLGGNGGNNTCWCSLLDVGGFGSLGQGGNSICAASGLSTCSCSGTGCVSGGGGGGGYYGGGAGLSFAGGGGGSSYTDMGAINVAHTQGYKTGNGQVIITVPCDVLTATVSSTTVCEGDLITLSATSSNGGTITWDNGITNGVAFVPASTGTTTYTATSTDVSDCTFSVAILVNPNPTVAGGVDILLCEVQDTMLEATGTADTYAWDNGVTDGVSFTPSVGTTTYTVTGEITATGCQATDEVDVIVTILDNGFSLAGITLTADQTSAAYQWVTCPTFADVVGATNQNFTPSADGDYAVIVTLNGCEDTSVCQTISGVGIGEENLNSAIRIYPNPVTHYLYIQGNQTFDYNVVDVRGSIVRKGQESGNAVIDMANLEDGVYMIHVITDGVTQTFQIVKN